jgi:hypothetical protein
MNEALGLGQLLREMMELNQVRDGQAMYSVVVTDTAGNVCEIEWMAEVGRWVCDQGADLARLRTRLRLDEPGPPSTVTPDAIARLEATGHDEA